MQPNNITPYNKTDFDLKDVELLINGGVDELEDAMSELRTKVKGSRQRFLILKNNLRQIKMISLGVAALGAAFFLTTKLIRKRG